MDLSLPVLDINCNTLYNSYYNPPIAINSAAYIGVHGDSNTCFDVDYNEVFSPWSNPGILIGGASDSLVIELDERHSDGSIDVNVYFTNLPQSAPSKPQFLKATKQYVSSPIGAFYVRLNWLRNKEPDISTYGIYKATTNTPGQDEQYLFFSLENCPTFRLKTAHPIYQ